MSEQLHKLHQKLILPQLAWVENAIKQVKEKVRTLVIATRELHGVVMDLEHVARASCVRLAGQIISRTVKAQMGSLPSNVHFSVRLTHEHACSMERKDLVLGSEQEGGSDHRQVFRSRKALRSSLLEHLLVVVCRTVKRRPCEDTADPVFFQKHPWNTHEIVAR